MDWNEFYFKSVVFCPGRIHEYESERKDYRALKLLDTISHPC
jgi:hypothetical protein